MNMMRSSLAALLGGALLITGAAVAPAQSVVTEPVGFTTLTVTGKPPTRRGFTYLALNMRRPTAFRGVVTTAAGTTLNFPANSFTANQFNGAAGAHYVEITNGSGIGFISDITATTTSSVTLADNLSSVITGGTTTVRFRSHWTVNTAFGVNNTTGLTGGEDAASSDNIILVNAVTGLSSVVYYNTDTNLWQIGDTPAGNLVIQPDIGFYVERKSATPVSFTITGEVKLGPSEIVIEGGNPVRNINVVPNPYPLASVTLAASNLYTGSDTTGVAGGEDAASSDNLQIFNPATGLFAVYYYNTDNSQWQTGDTAAGSTVIPEGASVVILRKAGRPAFRWIVPQPTMNL